jgi:hypothetical protein
MRSQSDIPTASRLIHLIIRNPNYYVHYQSMSRWFRRRWRRRRRRRVCVCVRFAFLSYKYCCCVKSGIIIMNNIILHKKKKWFFDSIALLGLKEDGMEKLKLKYAQTHRHIFLSCVCAVCHINGLRRSEAPSSRNIDPRAVKQYHVDGSTKRPTFYRLIHLSCCCCCCCCPALPCALRDWTLTEL